MLTTTQETEILTLLRTLPKDKVDEVKDFALFLKTKYQSNIDYSTEWTDEDLADFSNASLNYFDDQE
ncbi:MAG: hypothetical protein FD167_143 [bacterium]|nr:MAG: hypothetical protein FD167_143 [bacterium]